MRTATLCFLVKGDPVEEILLGLKKTGFGKGKYNGFGGKVEPGESIEEAAVRELAEETGVFVTPGDLRKMGKLVFFFPAQPEFDFEVHVFISRRWRGQPAESDEMQPGWFKVEAIPYDQMWQDDRYWLPMVLQGQQVNAEVVFEDDNESVKEFRSEAVGGVRHFR